MSDNPVVIESTRAQPVDWRPLAHHNLYKLDSHFDSRFNAMLRCESYLKSLYESIIRVHHASLVDNLLDCISKSTESYNNDGSCGSVISNRRKSFLSCVTTSLSDPDRETIINICLTELQNSGTPYLIVDIPCISCSSAHDIFSEMAECVRQKLEKRAETDRRRVVKTSSKVTASIIRISDAPLYILANYLSDFASSAQSESMEEIAKENASNASSQVAPADSFVVIILRHAEKIEPEVFSSIIERLALCTEFVVHLIPFHASLCPLPLRLSKTAQSLMEVSLHSTTAPWEIYDDFMAQVFAARQVPVSLPPSLIAWIHEGFWRSTGCVKSACDKVLLALSHHFSNRRSLLCMFEETQWLQDMKLCKRLTSRNVDDNKYQAISQLLAYMGADDIDGTGINLTLKEDVDKGDKGRSKEVNSAKTALMRSLERTRIDVDFFKCLRWLREKFVSSSSQRVEYCSDILWAAVRDVGKGKDKSRGCTLIPDLVGAIGSSILRVPTNTILATIKEMLMVLQDIQYKLPIIFPDEDEENEEESYEQGDLSSSACRKRKEFAAPTPYRIAKNKAIAAALQLQNDLKDHDSMFEEILDILLETGVHPSTIPAKLSKKQGSAKKSLKSGDTPLASGTTTSPSRAAKETVNTVLFSVHSPKKPRSPNLKQQTSPASPPPKVAAVSTEAFTSPQRPVFSSDPVAPPSSGGSRLKSLGAASPCSPGIVFQGSIYRFVEIATEDLISWVGSLADFFDSLPRPAPLRGILDVTDEACQQTLKVANGSIRSTYMRALMEPGTYFEYNPDMCILAEIVFAASNTANIFEWFDEFKKNCEDWQQLKDQKKNIKRPKGTDDSKTEEVSLKCRFVKALNSLERAGIIKIKNQHEVTRLTYMWMTC